MLEIVAVVSVPFILVSIILCMHHFLLKLTEYVDHTKLIYKARSTSRFILISYPVVLCLFLIFQYLSGDVYSDLFLNNIANLFLAILLLLPVSQFLLLLLSLTDRVSRESFRQLLKSPRVNKNSLIDFSSVIFVSVIKGGYRIVSLMFIFILRVISSQETPKDKEPSSNSYYENVNPGYRHQGTHDWMHSFRDDIW